MLVGGRGWGGGMRPKEVPGLCTQSGEQRRLGQEQGREDGPMLGSSVGWLGKLWEAPSLFPPRSSWTKGMLGFIVLRLTGPTHGFPEVVTEAQREDKACLESLCEEAGTWLPCSLYHHLSWAVQAGLVAEGCGQSSKPWVNKHGRASVTKTEDGHAVSS